MQEKLPLSFDKPGKVEKSYIDVISSISEIIDDARNGRMFILVDHEDRENEGDLVIPAQMATPDAINFMAKHGRGLICLALTSERISQLGLSLMSTQKFLILAAAKVFYFMTSKSYYQNVVFSV